MSKKKIVILTIMLIVLVGLVWFFLPKRSKARVFKIDGTIYVIQDCNCLRITDIDTRHHLVAGGSAETCYGLVYNCK